MATVRTVEEAKQYFGLPANCPVVEIVIDQLPASWSESERTGSNADKVAAAG